MNPNLNLKPRPKQTLIQIDEQIDQARQKQKAVRRDLRKRGI